MKQKKLYKNCEGNNRNADENNATIMRLVCSRSGLFLRFVVVVVVLVLLTLFHSMKCFKNRKDRERRKQSKDIHLHFEYVPLVSFLFIKCFFFFFFLLFHMGKLFLFS